MKTIICLVMLISSGSLFKNARKRSTQEDEIAKLAKDNLNPDFGWKECKKLGTPSYQLYLFSITLGTLAFLLFFF